MIGLIFSILIDQAGGTLAITRKTANTLITAAGFNTNYSEIEAVINGAIDYNNIADDGVTAATLASDVVRANYGLVQHTDGSLYVDVSDTTPCLEITDGGLRVKVDGSTITRSASGLVASVVSDHGSLTGLTDDDHTQYLLKTGSIASITTRDHDLLSGLTDNDHPQYTRGQSTGYKIDSGAASVGAGDTVVSFNFTFSATPKVVITEIYTSATDLASVYIKSRSTTGFTIYNATGLSMTVDWIAIGTAA